jgi:uncharacterized repeat protein (TIGR03803 family)
MSRIKSVRTLSAVLLVIIMVFLMFVPGAWAASKFKTLYKFTGGKDGGAPTGSLIFDAAGNLYGTTQDGGGDPNCAFGGCGTVFKLTPTSNGSWTESVLYSFKYGLRDGARPYAGLVFDHSGNLYGTTQAGGFDGYGVVFELSPNTDGSWTESIPYEFTNYPGGQTPFSGLILDQAGSLYGTTNHGGSSAHPDGVIFKLTPNGESALYDFCSLPKCADGAYPFAGLIFDQAGNLYGTTIDDGPRGHGVVFQLTPNSDGSWTESVLGSFPGIQYGRHPYAGVTFDAVGNLYGTTEGGGNLSQCDGSGCGVVFRLTPNAHGSWPEKVLHHFTGGTDGGNPFAAVIFDRSGNLYGTALRGGNVTDCKGGCGVVYKLTPNLKGPWKETVLHSFTGSNGEYPQGGLILDAAGGNLYGTTVGDGITSFGSVFEITP